MKNLLLLSFLLTTVLMGCDKEVVTPDGEYVGTFARTSPNSNWVTSNVTLNISGKSYSGTSDKQYYPVICKGTLEFKGSTLTVTPECMFTANFDWTLIFKGDYEVEAEGESLRLLKRHGDFTDVYNLKKAKKN
ncbi:MAG TPA: hypothetical protein VF622_15260 [Segetibacter sp.]|jgi:hypothetical protein